MCETLVASWGMVSREEADELCRTLEDSEGKERAASEMADLLYHALVLLRVQVMVHHVHGQGSVNSCFL